MSVASIRARLLTLHRWLALAVSPVLIIVILSGCVLAFRPILGRRAQPRSDGKVDAHALVAALDDLDPDASTKALFVTEDGRTLDLHGANKEPLGTFDIETRKPVPRESRLDVFDLAQKAHRGLFIGVHQIPDAATYALGLIILLGPFIAWPRRRHTLMGWHTAIGWLLLPIVALAPVTALLLRLHLAGSPRPPREGRAPREQVEPASGASIARAIEIAGDKQVDLRGLRAAARQGPTTVLLSIASTEGLTYQAVSVTTGAVNKVRPTPGLVKRIHEGTWAGPLSGGVSLLGGMALTTLLVTGVWSWARGIRRIKRRAAQPRSGKIEASRTG